MSSAIRKSLVIVAAAWCMLATVTGSGYAETPARSEALAQAMQRFVDEHTVAGAVLLVATKDKVLTLTPVGYADIAAGKPMRGDTLFWIASQSKPITAAALMMLVDDGKVKLDDPVAKYLPEFRDEWVKTEQDKEHLLLKRPAHPIQVRNLLTHTSGLPPTSPLERPSLDLYPLALRVRSYAMLPLNFQPDSKYEYSNAGINTAGRIVEVVSRMPFEAFLEKRLFAPLGMKDTTFWPNAEQLSRLAKSYKARLKEKGLEETTIGQLRYPLDDRERQPMPAGGLFSTASDLSLFYRMMACGGTLGGKRYLSEDAVRQMTSKQTGSLPNSYGFGFGTGGGRFGHGGAYSTDSAFHRDTGLITIFLVQQATWSGDGKNMLPTFQKAATDLFGPAASAPGKGAR